MRNADLKRGDAPLSGFRIREARFFPQSSFEIQAFFALLLLFGFFHSAYPAFLSAAPGLKGLSPLTLLALALFPPIFCKLAVLLLLPLPMPGEERLPLAEKWALPLDDGIRPSRLFFSFAAMLGLVFATSLAVEIVCRFSGISLPEQTLIQIARRLSWHGLAMIAASSVLLAPIVEELTYRLILFRLLNRAFPSFVSAILASAVFAAAHLNLKTFLPLFVMGLFLQDAFCRTRSILPSILMHAAFNLISIVLMGTQI